MRSTRVRSQPPVGSGGGSRAPDPLVRSVTEAFSAEWRVLCAAYPNILIEGREAAVEATIVALLPHLRQPLYSWRDGTSLPLPSDREGTLLLRGVGHLGRHEQTTLIEWLRSSASRLQLISTSPMPLFPSVERGVFLAELYYCLNTLRLDVGQGLTPLSPPRA